MKPIYLLFAIPIFLLIACSPQAIPTIDPIPVKASAIAIANTMIAMTTRPSLLSTTQPSFTPEPTAITPFIGGWHTSTDASEFDNSTTVVLALDAETPVQGWLDTTTPTLLLRCREGKVEVYINNGLQANVEVGQLRAATVRLRFDSGQAFESV